MKVGMAGGGWALLGLESSSTWGAQKGSLEGWHVGRDLKEEAQESKEARGPWGSRLVGVRGHGKDLGFDS